MKDGNRKPPINCPVERSQAKVSKGEGYKEKGEPIGTTPYRPVVTVVHCISSWNSFCLTFLFSRHPFLMLPLSLDLVCPWHLWILTVLPVACCLFGHFSPQQSHLDFAIRLRSLITALQITTKFFPVLETLYHKTCTKYFPVLLCTTLLHNILPRIYFFVLQDLHKALPSSYYFARQSLHEVLSSTALY